jgi:hypothetical protein
MCGKLKRAKNNNIRCKKCAGLARAMTDKPDITLPSHILVEDTIGQFGYNPLYLSTTSSKNVVIQCSSCGKKRITQKHTALRSKWCMVCRGREKQKKFTEAKRKYANKTEKQRACRKMQYIRDQSNPMKNMSCRIKANLNSAYNRKSKPERKPMGCFRFLSYTRSELVKHLETCLQGGCVICREPITGKWHLAHLKPVAHAKSPEEVIQLFQLSNLSVAHPSCNIRLGATDISGSRLIN